MPSIEAKILANPRYTQLASKQSRLRWGCALFILVAYFIFVIVALNYPELLAAKLSEDSIIPIGIPVSIALFVVQIILTIAYARLESNQFAKERETIIKEAQS